MLRRKLAVLAAVAGLTLSGSAALATPDEDPTCGRGAASGAECAGDNGAPGCDGLNVAEGTPAADAPGIELATDILDEGAEGDCDEG